MTNIVQTFLKHPKTTLKKRRMTKIFEPKKRYMSPGQEKAFLLQFEKILKGPILDTNMEEPT